MRPKDTGSNSTMAAAMFRAVEREIIRIVPPHMTYNFHVTSRVVSRGGTGHQTRVGRTGRHSGRSPPSSAWCSAYRPSPASCGGVTEDRRVLRALGAAPAVTAGDGLIGVLGAVVLGSLLAVVVAVGLSPLAPLGPVRPVYPDSGIRLRLDSARHRARGVGRRPRRSPSQRWPIGGRPTASPGSSRRARSRRGSPRGAEAAGMPVAGVVGVRFALEPGRGRTAVPVRSALLGTVLAVALVVATLTFASSLHTLVSHPPLYGWNWNYMLNPSNDVPPASPDAARPRPRRRRLDRRRLHQRRDRRPDRPHPHRHPRSKVAPPILSGHGLDANDQIVVGCGHAWPCSTSTSATP